MDPFRTVPTRKICSAIPIQYRTQLREIGMSSGIVRVIPAGFGWSVQTASLLAPISFATLEAAIASGWHYARIERSDLEIRKEDGTIRLRSAIFETANGEQTP